MNTEQAVDSINVQTQPHSTDERQSVPVRSEGNRPIERQHSPTLSLREAERLYEAASFLMWQYGVTFNVHLTILWHMLGMTDGALVTKALGMLNAEMAKWLKVGQWFEGMQRRSRRFGYGGLHHYIAVHENGGSEGLHTHELLVVPPPVLPDFIAWTKTRLRDLSGQPWIPDTAVYFSLSNARNEREAVERHWGWTRYVMKQTEPNVEVLGDDGTWTPATAIFKPWPHREMKPLPMTKAVVTSHTIGQTARRREGFVSSYMKGDYEAMHDGHELAEHRERVRRFKHEAEIAEVLATLHT